MIFGKVLRAIGASSELKGQDSFRLSIWLGEDGLDSALTEPLDGLLRHPQRLFVSIALGDAAQQRRDVHVAVTFLGGVDAVGIGQDLHKAEYSAETGLPAQPYFPRQAHQARIPARRGGVDARHLLHHQPGQVVSAVRAVLDQRHDRTVARSSDGEESLFHAVDAPYPALPRVVQHGQPHLLVQGGRDQAVGEAGGPAGDRAQVGAGPDEAVEVVGHDPGARRVEAETAPGGGGQLDGAGGSPGRAVGDRRHGNDQVVAAGAHG